TYRALASAVDARDSHTGDHSSRVAAFVLAVARCLDLPPSALAELEVAARLHDIGKIGVSDDILMKPGPLTSGQWELMRQHAVVGSSILHSAPLSQAIKDAVRHVHEWWDGRGYPDSLAGERIPLFARILAVADAFEAMTSDRPYRRALSSQQALAELRRMRGVQFDPQIVDAFCAWAQAGDVPGS
ncbi:MAG TPA: HD-GYP domain-containing protein, partial [bacterium]|nr:HD-GYP domain-containing protein [bacterium]